MPDRLPEEFEKERDPDTIPEETPFDTDEVKVTRAAEREYLESHGETVEIEEPPRTTLRRKIEDEMYGDGAAKKDKRLVIVTGPPASGKSETIKREGWLDPEGFGALLVDADEAKKRLPEYADGKNATAVHEESSDIADRVLARAVAAGDNIVHPCVGKTVGTDEDPGLRQLIDQALEAGYRVHLRLIHNSPEESARGVVGRFEESGRYVPPEYALHEVADRPLEAYEELQEVYRGDERVEFQLEKGEEGNPEQEAD